MTYIADLNIEQKYQAVVRDSRRLTPENTDEVREILLEVIDPEFVCKVDQSFGVLVNVKNEFGKQTHHRLYSVADIPERSGGKQMMKLLVKRCSYIDDFSGEQFEGLASNYLCDRKAGDEITITGPHELPFKVPADKTADLLLIGMGTGIAPFRAFIKHIYKNIGDWKGRIRLFYGANSGLELLYMNEKDGDLTQYYDEDTFEAFHALSPRPQWADPIALDVVLEEKGAEIKDMLNRNNTHVYVAGYEKIVPKLNKAFGSILGGEENWRLRKAELIAGSKWAEIIY